MTSTDGLRALFEPRLGPDLLGVDELRGTAGRVRFAAARAPDVFRVVHDELGYLHLSSVAGIDWESHREVVYVVWSDTDRNYLVLSTDVPADNPHIETAVNVWPSADWHEREAWEMVGITFDHHPDLRHLLMPEDYKFNPLLRSFKLHEPEELEVKTRHV